MDDAESRARSRAARGPLGCERASSFEQVVWLGDGTERSCESLQPWRCGRLVTLGELSLRGARWSDESARIELATRYLEEVLDRPVQAPDERSPREGRLLDDGGVCVSLWVIAEQRRGVTSYRRYELTVDAEGARVQTRATEEQTTGHDRPVR